MTLPVPSGRRSGWHFRLFGFPVRIDLSFLIVMVLLGLPGAAGAVDVAVWVLIGAVSVLAHELGHAFVARGTGSNPEIQLYSFGGVTTFAPARRLSRLRALSISVAGPLVGIVVGLALWFFIDTDGLTAGTTTDYAVRAAVFVNLGWGLLNLLPVLPLDGGHALVELLPGEPEVRQRRAAAVSVPVAGALALYALHRGYLFGAVLAGWLAFDNVRLLAASSPAASEPLPPPRAATEGDRDVLWLVDQGRVDQARHLLDTLPPERIVDPAVRGLVLALAGRAEQGAPLVRHAYAQAPTDPLRAAVFARLLLAARDWPELTGLLRSGSGTLVPVELAVAGQVAALRSGAWGAAADLGGAVLPRAGDHLALVAYNTACALSRAGRLDEAVEALTTAVDAGWDDAAALDRDDDLAALRDVPAFELLRSRVR